MRIKPIIALCAGLAGSCLLAGCNVGMAPKGPDLEEVKQKEASLPPQQQIDLVRSSPMTATDKAKRIKEIEDKYNVKADAAPQNPGNPGGQPTTK